MNRPAPCRLIVLRHGQSEWNAALGGQYLDPHAARDAIEVIENQHTTDLEEVRYEQQAR